MRYTSQISLFLLVCSLVSNYIVGFNSGNIWISGILAVYHGYSLFLDHVKKPDFNETILEYIDETKKEISDNITADKLATQNRFNKIDDKVASISVAAQRVKTVTKQQEPQKYRF